MWFTSERATLPSGPANSTKAPSRQQHVMSQQRKAPRTYTEADIQLTISDIQLN
jgi:hypothetical protein